MNLVHKLSYRKVSPDVLHNRQELSSVSQFEFFILKMDNESISLHSSGKSYNFFGPK